MNFGLDPTESILMKSDGRDAFVKRQPSGSDEMQLTTGVTTVESVAPKVSIVLPLYNSAKELPAALFELNKQSFEDREIILVDDGSTDTTWKTASALAAGRDDIVLVRTEHRGPAHARNVGLFGSRGEIIFFSESDCVYDPAYLQKAVDTLNSRSEAAAVCLTGAPLVTRVTLATTCIEIENKVQHRLLEQGKMQPFYAWVYRREVLLKLGGFDERLFQGEDRDLFRRVKNAKYEVVLVPGVNWRHVRDQTLTELADKWFGRGRTRLLYLIKHRRTFDILKSIVPFWATIVGLVVLPFFPLFGAGILLTVAAAFLARTLRTMSVSWPLVERKRSYFGYPLFIAVRNFATALGYSIAMVTILVKGLKGEEVTWDEL